MWLSRGPFLARFTEFLPEMNNFLKLSKHTEHNQLDDSLWLLNLTFLTDISDMLNNLNLELQCRDKHMINTIS